MGLAGLLVLRASGVRGVAPYLLLAAVLWYGVLRAGIHPTIAGVVTVLAASAFAAVATLVAGRVLLPPSASPAAGAADGGTGADGAGEPR